MSSHGHPLPLSSCLHSLASRQLKALAGGSSVRISKEALSKMEACLGTLLKEMGRNLSTLLQSQGKVTLTAGYVMLYADIGLHLTPHCLDELNLEMQKKPQRAETDDGQVRRTSKSRQYGLTLSMPRVMDLLDHGMKEQLSQRYSYSPDASVGCVWLVERVVEWVLGKAVQRLAQRQSREVRGVDVKEDWLHSFIGGQKAY